MHLSPNVMCLKYFILFNNSCYKISRNKNMKFLMTNAQICTKVAGQVIYAEFSKVLEYLSKVSQRKPVFYFPQSGEANVFHSLKKSLKTIEKVPTPLKIAITFGDFIQGSFFNCRDNSYFYLRSGLGEATVYSKGRKYCLDHEENIKIKFFCVADKTPVLLCTSTDGVTKTFSYREALKLEEKDNILLGMPNHKSAFYTFSLLRNSFVEMTSSNLENIFYISRRLIINGTFNLATKSLQIVKCSDGILMSLKFLYDEVSKCTGEIGLPHAACKSNVNGEIQNWTICRDLCFRINCTCSELYYHKPHGGCSPYSFTMDGPGTVQGILFLDRDRKIQNTDLQAVNLQGITVYRIRTVHKSGKQLNHEKSIHLNFLDCTEAELEGLYFIKECDHPEHIQCTFGCARCFHVFHLCVYELDNDGNLLHCPSGSHLKNCEDMQCNNMFKCNYCVPYRYVF